MSDVNLHESIVRYLEGRGRWLKAGNDNIIGYLSIQINAGPGRLHDIQEVLLNAEVPLHVEHVNGRVSMVGLQEWREKGRPSDDFSDDKSAELLSALIASYAREARLTSELATLREGCQDASSDELMGEALQAIGERDGLIGRIADLETQLAAAGECESCASMARRLEGARSAAQTARESYQASQQTNAALNVELGDVKRTLKFALENIGRMMDFMDVLHDHRRKCMCSALRRQVDEFGRRMLDFANQEAKK